VGLQKTIKRTVSKEISRQWPWYESTLLWGAGGAGIAVVLVVVAAMMEDLRWLLIIAWLFLCLATWSIVRHLLHRSVRWIAFSSLSIVIAIGLGRLDTSMPKKSSTRPQASRSPSASEIAAELAKTLPGPSAKTEQTPTAKSGDLGPNVLFKDSPLFTEDRKQHITKRLRGFYHYLRDIGFEPPLLSPA
jgi:hypothetical protein